MSKFWTIGSEQWFPTWEAARAAQVAFTQEGAVVEIEEHTTEDAYGVPSDLASYSIVALRRSLNDPSLHAAVRAAIELELAGR